MSSLAGQVWDKIVQGAFKVGGWLALVGAAIGGYLAFPKCETEVSFGGFSESCRNIFGPIEEDIVGNATFPGGQFFGMIIVGALVGGLVGLGIAAIWPNSKKDLGIEDE